ncbi:hypothetical protein ACCAA_270124 [Candidatus Accumulibacter aalborgensis]|uniref:Uncharacterized protein n=1 Tax=Candidatus Accumulibacter aalborgensis TaxID=1860102 RepID=A0A1A8XN94_9PROT|nr:hypothetical protein ACCAA_270124 [Candidatus Accumulibacter aalborgensis]
MPKKQSVFEDFYELWGRPIRGLARVCLCALGAELSGCVCALACVLSGHATAIPECLGIQHVVRLHSWALPSPR